MKRGFFRHHIVLFGSLHIKTEGACFIQTAHQLNISGLKINLIFETLHFIKGDDYGSEDKIKTKIRIERKERKTGKSGNFKLH